MKCNPEVFPRPIGVLKYEYVARCAIHQWQEIRNHPEDAMKAMRQHLAENPQRKDGE